jgi:hypothetical protein
MALVGPFFRGLAGVLALAAIGAAILGSLYLVVLLAVSLVSDPVGAAEILASTGLIVGTAIAAWRWFADNVGDSAGGLRFPLLGGVITFIGWGPDRKSRAQSEPNRRAERRVSYRLQVASTIAGMATGIGGLAVAIAALFLE